MYSTLVMFVLFLCGNTFQVKVSMKIKKFIWFSVPCKKGVGSCTYDDFCKLLPKATCPAILQKYGIPCHCPFAKVS